MKHSVRSTLLCLGAGVILQRVLQLLAFVIVFGMLMAQAKRMRLVLESDDPDSAVGGSLVLRLAGGLMFFVIIAAVVLRFGSV